MKITKIVSFLKKGKRIILYDTPDNTQWIGDGRAAFPLFNLPQLEEETTFAIFDISEKEQEKYYFNHTDLPPGMNFSDNDPSENELEKTDLVFYTGGYSLKPLQTSKGLALLDMKHLAPFGDMSNGVELFERTTTKGDVYIAVKTGLLLAGIILPNNQVINETFVEQMEGILKHSRRALEIQAEKKAMRDPSQIGFDEE